MPEIDAHARVDPDARLGSGVTVGPGVVIEAGVRVGDRCRVEPHAVLYRGTRVGNDVRIGVGSVLGGTPQDTKFRGGDSAVWIGDRTVIHQYVTVHRCVEPGATTHVGADCLLMVNSHVGHECVVGDGVVLANGVMLGGHSRVGDRAFLSGNVVVHQFSRIGRLAMVGGGSAVRQDIVPFCLADGHPARPSGLNRIGLERAGFDDATVTALRRAYRTLFQRGIRLQTALRRLEREPAVPELVELARFVRGSERGIARPRRRR